MHTTTITRSLAALTLLSSACVSDADDAPQAGAASLVLPATDIEHRLLMSARRNVSFILNVDDFVNAAESLHYVSAIVNLHIARSVPLHIYITSPVYSQWERLPLLSDRSLFTALRAQLIVHGLGAEGDGLIAVSTLLRAPYPYYQNNWSDWRSAPIAGFSRGIRYAILNAYESHDLDMSTGLLTTAPGGYSRLRDDLGYPPVAVTQASGSDNVSQSLACVYKDMGASVVVQHGDNVTGMNACANGLLRRPFTTSYTIDRDEVVSSGATTAAQVFDACTASSGCHANNTDWDAIPLGGFLDLHWHIGRFYMRGAAWAPIYYDWDVDCTESSCCNYSLDTQGAPQSPPWDLADGLAPSTHWGTHVPTCESGNTSERGTTMLEQYEVMLDYFASRSPWHVVSGADLRSLASLAACTTSACDASMLPNVDCHTLGLCP